MLAGAYDIGGGKTALGVVDQSGKVLWKDQFETYTPSFARHIEDCNARFAGGLKSLGINADALCGIGVNVPGTARDNMLLVAPFAKWENIAVREYIEPVFSLSVAVENDVNACALAEMRFGFGRERSLTDFLWVTVSTGVGGAVVAGGQLLRGARSQAGEIGHVKVRDRAGYECSCGQLGCLEAMASGTGIGRATRDMLKGDPAAAERMKAAGAAPDAKGCAHMARLGDMPFAAIYRRAGDDLGRALSCAINLLNPAQIFIGGGVGLSFDLLLPGIRERIRTDVNAHMQQVDILQTRLGYDAALLGAASLAMPETRKDAYEA